MEDMDSLQQKSNPYNADKENFSTPPATSKPFSRKADLYIPYDPKPKKPNLKKNVWLFFLKKTAILLGSFLISAGIFYALFFIWKAHSISALMNDDKQTSLAQDVKNVLSSFVPSQRKALSGEDSGRINILMLGAAGEKDAGRNLTDTIMVMSIDTKNKKMALLSLPRDLYVQIPDSNSFTKINGLYSIGVKNDQAADLIQETVEKITGLKINYYMIANYDGFKDVVDSLGGINVTVDRDIYDNRYPGPNYSYQTFQIKKGLHNMDGETALKFVRERHDDPEGDFGRAKRQQKVIQAIKNKMFSLKTFLNISALNSMLNAVGNNIKTNISLAEIESFIDLSKQVDTQNINNVVVDAWKKDSILKVSHVQAGAVRAFILVPRVGNFSEIQEQAANIFDADILKKRKELIFEEKAAIVLINESGDPSLSWKVKNMLSEKMQIKNVEIENSKTTLQREKTIVTDNTASKKLYTLDEIIKKLPATLEKNNPTLNDSMKADFAIFLGKDLLDAYNYEEDSIDDFNQAKDDQLYLDLLEQPKAGKIKP
jgi:LCP family protein required for cell wall assembly